jgi:non-ribosomal peptide synthetase component F
VAILAVLKAGGAYVPLDPSGQAEFLKEVMRKTKAKYVLTESLFASLFDKTNLMSSVIFVDEVSHVEFSNRKKIPLIKPNSPAYPMYTSGSARFPKAVIVTHYNLI